MTYSPAPTDKLSMLPLMKKLLWPVHAYFCNTSHTDHTGVTELYHISHTVTVFLW